MLRYGTVEEVRLDVHTGTAFITFIDVERAKKLVGASQKSAFPVALAQIQQRKPCAQCSSRR